MWTQKFVTENSSGVFFALISSFVGHISSIIMAERNPPLCIIYMKLEVHPNV
jgi:hypothetical protein